MKFRSKLKTAMLCWKFCAEYHEYFF